MGTEAVQDWWLEEKVERWKYLVEIMAGVAYNHPLTAYVGLQKSLQKEWDFLRRITSYIEIMFQPV